MTTPDHFVARVWQSDESGRCVEERTFVFPSTATLADVAAKVFDHWLSCGEFRVTPAEIGMPNAAGQTPAARKDG